jgi:hypothetical protein
MVAGLVVTSASAAANIAFRGAAVASEKPSDDSLSASNAAIKILAARWCAPMARKTGSFVPETILKGDAVRFGLVMILSPDGG